MITEELISLLILHHIKGLGPKSIRKILATESPQEAVKRFKVDESWKRDLEAIEKEKIQLLSFLCPGYPQQFFALDDPPLLLYVKGKLSKEGIAIVGTRNASIYGKEYATKFGRELAQAGETVVSGLARGIDTAAHRGALERGSTIAFLGSGIGNIYPQENSKLAADITLISEYPVMQSASTYTFPRRNRLIAAFSRALLLIESPRVGGSMITANLALQLKKEVFALPARVDMPSFAGNHYLIKNGQAKLLESCQDLPLNGQITYTQPLTIHAPTLTDEERSFIAALPCEEKSIEELVLLTQLPVMKLNVLLNRLVVKKVIREYPGKVYGKIINHR